MLKHHCHLVPPNFDHLTIASGQEVLTIEQNLAGCRFDEPRQAAHKSRLARPRQPHDDENFAVANLKIDLADRADQPDGLQFIQVRFAPQTGQFLGSTGPKQLPDIPTDEFRLVQSRQGHCHRRRSQGIA